jgi:tetratricopeptide (TPR) repeat protein
MRTKVTEQVLTLDEALQETIPALLALLDALPQDSPFLRLDPPQRRQRTLDALTRLLVRESQRQPVLLVFEDLHWIDTETQALLDSLVESLPTAPLLLLVNYRPQYQYRWGSQTFSTQLRLDPLPPASAEALLQCLLGEDASLVPLTRLLIERTGGNPFFLEESVRTLVETGALGGERGAYYLAQALPTLQVPATVQVVLAARLDRLPPEAKRLLQTAAVIGIEVPFPLLQAIAALPETTLHRYLAHLQAAAFLYETRLFPERGYTFKHALTHEVAYGSLLQERRRVLHATIVEAMETLYTAHLADHVERLAHHTFRGETWDKAVAYCRQAGAKANDRSAHREAVASFEQALVALQHLPETPDTLRQTIDLRFSLRNALLPLGEHGRICDHLRLAETLARRLHDQRRLGQAFAYLAEYFRLTGAAAHAVTSGERALALALALGDFALQVMATFFLGAACSALGEYRQAVAYFRRNVASLTGELRWKRFGMTGLPAVMSRTWLVSCLADLGEFDEGIARGDEAIQLAESTEHPFSLTQAYYALGTLFLRQGDLPKAIPVLERGLALCQGVGIVTWFPTVAAALGYTYTLSGRLPEALPLLQQAVAQDPSKGISAGHARRVAYLSEAYLLAGRRDEAVDLATHALAFARTLKARGNEAYALWLHGEMAAHQALRTGETADACYHQALALAHELGMRPLQAHCHRCLGTLYGRTKQWAQACTEFAAAIAMYQSMDMTFWLPQTEAALAQLERQ